MIQCESTSVPVLELVKTTPTEEETGVIENGSPLAGYRANDDREKPFDPLGLIPPFVDQSSAAGDLKGIIRMQITDTVSTVCIANIFDILFTSTNAWRN